MGKWMNKRTELCNFNKITEFIDPALLKFSYFLIVQDTWLLYRPISSIAVFP